MYIISFLNTYVKALYTCFFVLFFLEKLMHKPVITTIENTTAPSRHTPITALLLLTSMQCNIFTQQQVTNYDTDEIINSGRGTVKIIPQELPFV